MALELGKEAPFQRLEVSGTTSSASGDREGSVGLWICAVWEQDQARKADLSREFPTRPVSVPSFLPPHLPASPSLPLSVHFPVCVCLSVCSSLWVFLFLSLRLSLRECVCLTSTPSRPLTIVNSLGMPAPCSRPRPVRIPFSAPESPALKTRPTPPSSTYTQPGHGTPRAGIRRVPGVRPGGKEPIQYWAGLAGGPCPGSAYSGPAHLETALAPPPQAL